MTDPHWFKPQPDMCVECLHPAADPVHLRLCNDAWTVRGVGFAFCQLHKGHDGPHHLRNWDGSMWEAWSDDDGSLHTQPMEVTQ